MKDVLILGAGPAGLACAFELSKKGIQPTIIEKEDEVGGLARTLKYKEGKDIFLTDIGPHRFFSKNKYLYQMISDLIGKDWIEVKRQTRQLIDGKFYDYPINAMQAFKNIGPIRGTKMGFSYLIGVAEYNLLGKKVNNFEDYIIANFGRDLGNFNMLNYTEKVWGIPCTEVHSDWATQRIKGLNLISAAKNAIFKTKGVKTLVDAFFYPRTGTGLIYETIAKRVKKNGAKIFTQSYPTKIRHKGNKITQVELTVDGKQIKYTPDKLVSSIPLTEFLNILSPTPPKKVRLAAKKLKWRSQAYLFITLNKEKVTTDNWIYFPNLEVPFGRTAEMKNFSKIMSPKGKTSMFVEFFVNEGDKIWNMSEKELFEITVRDLERFGLVKRDEVINYHLIKRRNVYPIYDVNYKKYLKVVKEYLDSFKNLYYIGRPGRFKYNNQDHSLEMGIEAAKGIVQNIPVDLDSIGEENEYFEKGKLEGKAKE